MSFSQLFFAEKWCFSDLSGWSLSTGYPPPEAVGFVTKTDTGEYLALRSEHIKSETYWTADLKDAMRWVQGVDDAN